MIDGLGHYPLGGPSYYCPQQKNLHTEDKRPFLYILHINLPLRLWVKKPTPKTWHEKQPQSCSFRECLTVWNAFRFSMNCHTFICTEIRWRHSHLWKLLKFWCFKAQSKWSAQWSVVNSGFWEVQNAPASTRRHIIAFVLMLTHCSPSCFWISELVICCCFLPVSQFLLFWIEVVACFELGFFFCYWGPWPLGSDNYVDTYEVDNKEVKSILSRLILTGWEDSR